ncbi:ABCC3 isoform 19 [Pan troglodytes]|uniref:ABCC3 isoform 19 n=1 Tax=Pan troglodytes TaxID=9598 RepID=A0A2J8MFT9_PANTR|nr:ABCC3 isoform 19 [Pan troglodytes]
MDALCGSGELGSKFWNPAHCLTHQGPHQTLSRARVTLQGRGSL